MTSAGVGQRGEVTGREQKGERRWAAPAAGAAQSAPGVGWRSGATVCRGHAQDLPEEDFALSCAAGFSTAFGLVFCGLFFFSPKACLATFDFFRKKLIF